MPDDDEAIALEEYTVGWLCALPLEMAAAKGMLDRVHPDLCEQDPYDHNSYTLGEIQGHYVVIACLPAKNYGSCSVATVVKDLQRTFKSIRFGLLVGIGSGAPSPQHDIRLGDVVISQPSGTLGGVVQHDRGKILPQGGFQRTGYSNAPPQLLLTALARLQATHMCEDSGVPEFLAQLVAKAPQRMRDKFSYQGASNDRLYQADYHHVKCGDPTCNGCDKSHIIHRPERDDTDPYFHYGIIASASAAVKDGQTRQRLSQEYGAMCFDTEAAGLYDFPCLIIRGIHDYADSHTTDLWQEYAAATAAAFAKELLLFVTPVRIQRVEKAFDDVVSTAYNGFKIPVQSLPQQNYIKHMMNNQPMSLYMVGSARYNCEDTQESTRYEDGTRPLSLEVIEK
ncbi:G-protein beta WD-40 repeat-containing protein [Fusarium pseudoanthophilum]|uniref:G-protein beta WD-40 repeat-containing protein n=1 Tax=Fusarium pseudoanthophilum TaxID=48495 RepID=A0A8H5P6S3_9HYPO|nr:G-protein beta WD-40 repeat-containing protein [Fusarium pseudoanthophilum]